MHNAYAYAYVQWPTATTSYQNYTDLVILSPFSYLLVSDFETFLP